MQLEDVFEFDGPDAIRIKGHRIGIESVLRKCVAGQPVEEIARQYDTLRPLEIHATITYYLQNQEAVDAYLALEHDSTVRHEYHDGYVYAMAGGVSGLQLKTVEVQGTKAHVKAEVTIWYKTAQFWTNPRPNLPSASNILDLDLQLTKGVDGWRIESSSEQFAPGGGP